MARAEKVFNSRKTPEDHQTRGLAKVLLTAINQGCPDERQLKNLACGRGRGKPVPTEGETQPPLQRDRCAYCKEKSHWKNECPKENPRVDTKVLELEELSD